MRKEGKSLVEVLDARVKDTCANFTELLQMLHMFPDRKEWAKGDISGLRDKMLESLKTKQNGTGTTTRSKKPRRKVEVRHSVTLAEKREMEAEIERLKGELKAANQIIKSLEMQLEAARETIGSLNEAISLLRLQMGGAEATSQV
jgi:chromosome segregation ATPase